MLDEADSEAVGLIKADVTAELLACCAGYLDRLVEFYFIYILAADTESRRERIIFNHYTAGSSWKS